jgi:aryl-alcohol dehydrogenase-like predicted oxidoreductase
MEVSTMNTRQLGRTGPRVSMIGLGAMGMSDLYGPADETESIATIARALKGRDRDSVMLRVEFGALRDPNRGWGGYDARPAAVKSFLAYSLTRLGTDHVDVYRPARLDPRVPIEETVGAIADDSGATVAQLAIAWVLSRAPDVVALVGARRRKRLDEALGATGLELTTAELERIEAAVPAGAAAGARYAEPLMAELDSERRSA